MTCGDPGSDDFAITLAPTLAHPPILGTLRNPADRLRAKVHNALQIILPAVREDSRVLPEFRRRTTPEPGYALRPALARLTRPSTCGGRTNHTIGRARQYPLTKLITYHLVLVAS